MTSSIPTSTSVLESAVIDASLADVWRLIKLSDFDKFWTRLEKTDTVKGASPDTEVVKWVFKDGIFLPKLTSARLGALRNTEWLMRGTSQGPSLRSSRKNIPYVSKVLALQPTANIPRNFRY
jgi:hypothetical protein